MARFLAQTPRLEFSIGAVLLFLYMHLYVRTPPPKVLRQAEFKADPRTPDSCLSTAEDIAYFSYTSPFSLKPKLDLNAADNFVIYIMSAIGELEERRIIRNTWANFEYINKYKLHNFTVQRMFVIGGLRYVDQDLRHLVLKEQEEEKDLFSIDDLKDSYGNLTEKSIYSLNYITRTFDLDKIDFLFKVDSDNFINIFKFLHLAWQYKISGRRKTDLICFWRPVSKVERSGKYRESVSRYSPSTYPEYCSGPAYVASRAVIPRLVNASHSVPILQSEDVMLTGVGLKDTGSVAVHKLRRRDTYYDHYSWERKTMVELRNAFVHMYYIHELPHRSWQKLSDQLLVDLSLN